MRHRVFVVFLIAVACALPALAFLLGRSQFAASEDARHERVAATHSVPATLQENLYGTPGVFGRSGGEIRAQVSWTAADGSVRVDKAPVRPPGSIGQPTTIWLDRDGDPVTEPPQRVQSLLDGFSVGAAVLMAGGGILAGGYAVERRLFMRARMNAWAREWAQVAPRWTTRA